MDKPDQHQSETEETVIEVVIVAEYIRSGRPVPRGHKYEIEVNEDNYVVDHHLVTDKQLLALRGECRCSHEVFQAIPHRDAERVPTGHEIDLCAAGIERFFTVPLEVVKFSVEVPGTDQAPSKVVELEHKPGEVPVSWIRQQLELPSAYILYLSSRGSEVKDGTRVLIKGCEEFIAQVDGGTSS